MIIESVRLMNIKSYGQGEDGRGITIYFVPGTNRIAGLNGHGKTTLIEAIGYALFFCDPLFEENFQIATYFLRIGETSGEIDVDFLHEHERYRIERNLGATRRRTKVIQIKEGSICAEGDAEVRGFLCRLFGFEKAEHLAELFSKLVGVRQGRLTWPFDTTLRDAKKFFEPLLEVAIFRECFDRLKPVVDDFGGQWHAQQRLLAGIEERIRERAGSEQRVEEKRTRRLEIELRLKELTKVRDAARLLKEALELRERYSMDADRLREAIRSAFGLAKQQYENALLRSKEARVAAEIILTVAPGFHAFEEAEISVRQLRIQQQDHVLLEKQKNAVEKRLTVFEGKLNSVREQAEFLMRQIREKEETKAAGQERVNALDQGLATSLADFEFRRAAADGILKDLGEISLSFKAAETTFTGRGENIREIITIQREIRSWNGDVLEQTRRSECAADAHLQEVRQQLAEADSARATLKTQLAEIGGGFCPFLKEQCKQFDPARVSEDLGDKERLVDELKRQAAIAKSEFDRVKTDRERSEREAAEMVARQVKVDDLVRRSITSLNGLIPARIEMATARLLDEFPDLKRMPQTPLIPPENATALMVAHQASLALNDDMVRWKETLEARVDARVLAIRAEQRQRDVRAQDLSNLKVYLSDLGKEIAKLIAGEKGHREKEKSLEGEIKEAGEELIDLARKNEVYAPVAGEIEKMERIQQSERQNHERYLGAKPLADQINNREEELRNRQVVMIQAAKELERQETAYLEIRKDFDPISLAAAKKEFEERGLDVARETAHLTNAIEDFKTEEKRLREWEIARKDHETIVRAIGRIEASIELTEFARTFLRACAPEVAQHLCNRIAERAQQIFNQINHDPVELNWEATPRYSLRVIPGDRRFAMLSGGEQTKLALSMTLAMIQQFSRMRFCIFDEPTYGVDAESREKLADAILTVERAAALDQLIIVSHDDAFNGKIEHSILLRKRADLGTEVV